MVSARLSPSKFARPRASALGIAPFSTEPSSKSLGSLALPFRSARTLCLELSSDRPDPQAPRLSAARRPGARADLAGRFPAGGSRVGRGGETGAPAERGPEPSCRWARFSRWVKLNRDRPVLFCPFPGLLYTREDFASLFYARNGQRTL